MLGFKKNGGNPLQVEIKKSFVFFKWISRRQKRLEVTVEHEFEGRT